MPAHIHTRAGCMRTAYAFLSRKTVSVLPSSCEPWNFSIDREAASLVVKRTVPQPCSGRQRETEKKRQCSSTHSGGNDKETVNHSTREVQHTQAVSLQAVPGHACVLLGRSCASTCTLILAYIPSANTTHLAAAVRGGHDLALLDLAALSHQVTQVALGELPGNALDAHLFFCAAATTSVFGGRADTRAEQSNTPLTDR